MIERAGVNVDPADISAPGALERFGEKPAAVAFPGKLRNQTEEGELALAGLAEVEFEYSGIPPAVIDYREKLHLRVVEYRR